MQLLTLIMEKNKAIADTYNNRFCIPLDFELLIDHQPFYQTGLANRLSYELTFNNYSKVISSTDVDAKFNISGNSLEYEVVTNVELARMIKNQYSGKMAILYDRVLRHRVIPLNRTDTTWNINLNTPAKSMKAKQILLLFRKSDAK